ncbi:DsbA family protein [Psychrosphaera sp.]|nr:DsbA family protein [Psychrosphaera sp.]
MMKIEFWLNILSPYSYLAHLQLKSAIAVSGCQNVVTEYKWFPEISDQAVSGQNIWDIKQFYTQTFEQSEVWSQLLFEDFKKHAKILGRDMQLDILHLPETSLSESIKAAELKGVAEPFVDFLFTAFWEQGTKIATETIENFYKNLNYSNNALIETRQVETLLKDDELLTKELGITEAPMMIVNEEIGLCGIQPIEHLVEVISMAQSN